MEAVLKNIGNTVEVLAVASQSNVVAHWDKLTLSRAFHWARYCEHLYSRFHNNPAIRGVMEKQLRLTNEKLKAAFPGYSEVSFSDLSRSHSLLLTGLLNNPELPSSIMKILFDTHESTHQGDQQDVTGLCSHIIQCKSACKVLIPLTEWSACGADAEVQGVMLMEKLVAMLSQGSEAGQMEHFLDSVLQGCEGAADYFCSVIAAALLTTENSTAQAASQDLLLDWLQKKQHELQRMCSALPTALLTDLVKKHLKFREAYCDILKKWASGMEYSISDSEWNHISTDQSLSFHRLTEHFLALFEACPSLREDVEKGLNVLKISDGDFDVRGLSIWGDLLSALNK